MKITRKVKEKIRNALTKFLLSGIVFICFQLILFGQESVVVSGLVTGENGEILSGATILNLSSRKGAYADETGRFQLTVPAGEEISFEISFIGYLKDTVSISGTSRESAYLRVILKLKSQDVGEVIVENKNDRSEALQLINIRSLTHIPIPSGNIESVLTTMGASSRNELSSQYSVRGGNFDENLIYVNGIEIYRPMLVKSGQQEGLSFVNSSMISTIQFASGGFDARYGDKMSSVLDIKYKRPSSFGASANASLLGYAVHAEGSAFKNRLTHITGVRYKTNQYLLGTLQTKADYYPRFFDVQSFVTYDLTRQVEISFLGNIALNQYKVVPQSRQTAFGTYQQPLNFTVYYEGKEMDRFATMLGALTLDYKPSEKLSLRFSGEGFNTSEEITYDILGEYRIDYLDKTPGSKTSSDSILNLGYGGNLIHARNYLNADIFNICHKGSYRGKKSNINWGITAQKEHFTDKIREWELIDSAGYSIPFSDQEIRLQNVVISHNSLESYRYSGFLQNTTSHQIGNTEITINAGIRAGWLNTNRQFLLSPRVSLFLKPDWDKELTFHISAGWYQQPPFYKEMVDPGGKLHKNIRAQRSVHFVAGTDLDFFIWQRPFRFSAEAYYKKLDRLIPYIVDDIDIQYLPQYSAKGFATGIEFKINGEFVKDAESWATLSLLQTYEKRNDAPSDYYPRPTNQLLNVGLFFQDYFPNNPSFRLHLNAYYGSKLPYTTKDYENPDKYFHLDSYRRIDIGISKSLLTNSAGVKRPSRIFDDVFIGAEIFNLFGFKNQASFQWVRTVSNQEGIPNTFAVPNYLTGRLLNLRILFNF